MTVQPTEGETYRVQFDDHNYYPQQPFTITVVTVKDGCIWGKVETQSVIDEHVRSAEHTFGKCNDAEVTDECYAFATVSADGTVNEDRDVIFFGDEEFQDAVVEE